MKNTKINLFMKKLFSRLNQLQTASANRAASFTINRGDSDPLFYTFSRKKNLVGFTSNALGHKEYTKAPFILQVLFMLKQEGYMRYFTIETKGRSVFVTVFLKYTQQGNPGIRSISNLSTPGRVLYVSINSL
jgi:ribosomal protein S8